MRKNNAVFLLILVVLLSVSLACGSSTSEKLESAISDTPVSNAISESPVTSMPQQEQSTEVDLQTPTPVAESIRLVAQGFGQQDQEIGYAFIIENPNTQIAFENSQYQIAAYDDSGAVVETDSGFIELILPGQKLGISGNVFVSEGVKVSKIDVQMKTGEPVSTDLKTTFAVDKIMYFPDKYFSKITAVVSNPFNIDLTNLFVSAVTYNDAGDIIGGGFTFVNFIPANGNTGVQVTTTSSGTVSKVELYPIVSGLTLLTQEYEKLPEGADNLILEKQGFGQNDIEIGYGFLVKNPNNNFSVESTMYRVTAFDSDGNVLSTDEGFINILLPNQLMGIGKSLFVNDGQTVSNAVIQIKSGEYKAASEMPTFSFENVSYQPDDYFPAVTGLVINPYTKDITQLVIYALAYDEEDNIIGGGFTFLDFVPASGKSAVEVNITSSKPPTRVDLFGTLSSLSEIGD